MKYVLIEQGAATEIVSNRYFQSIEFELGHSLIALLKGEVKQILLPPTLALIKLNEGFAISKKGETTKSNFLVIDEEQSSFFSSKNDNEALFVFQKTLRFAIKMWRNLSTNFSELVVPQSSKAILFPFGHTAKPYRVVFERAPLAERLEKRGYKDRFLLAYKTGQDAGDSKKEKAEETNFRKVFDQIRTIHEVSRDDNSQTVNSETVDRTLQVTELQNLEHAGNPTSMFRTFKTWQSMLTNAQERFVRSDIIGAHRIEGAAGTGKTLSLMLKAVFALQRAEREGREFHAVFVTHSNSTKASILDYLSVIDDHHFAKREKTLTNVSLRVTTLSELCAEQLRQQVSASEFIDRDAMESKELQRVYVEDAFSHVLAHDYPSHEKYLSSEYKDFLSSVSSWDAAEMFQHEISVMIKGRASENLDAYKKAPPLKYGIPISTDADKGYTFTVFRKYQALLGEAAQFDTDDVVLTAIGQLDTPVWRRRRRKDGFDAIFIDETHLFNINELHIFHHFTRDENEYPIVYSVDRSQAVGDHGWNNDDIELALTKENDGKVSTTQSALGTVFRSSPQIVSLAFSVVSSGASLFTNFDNPLESTTSSFTLDEDRLAEDPTYWEYPNQTALIAGAFVQLEKMQQSLKCRKSDILIVSLDKTVIEELKEFASNKNKPFTLLSKRGDLEAVESARMSGKIVIAHADYVGGLEFLGAIIVGVDGGRVPPTSSDDSENSRNFQLFSAHNRLYVAVSRAKYQVHISGEKVRGPSRLLEPALSSKLLTRVS